MAILIVKNGKITGSITNSGQLSGEKIPGDLKSWDYVGTNPNVVLKYTYNILSQRSTTLYHTHPPVTSAINKTTQYAIGSGLVFRSQPDWEILDMTKEKAKEWGMTFQKFVHYIFQILNYYEKQSILFRTGLIMGDSLLFFDRSPEATKNKMPFDLVETGGDQIDFQGKPKATNKEATLGIIHDKGLRKQGIILVDGTETDFSDENGDQNVLQCYHKFMARQLRGYPLAYRIIAAAKNNDRWWDATLSRAVMETIILGYSSDESEENSLKNQVDNLAEIGRGEKGLSRATVNTDATVKELIAGGILSYTGKGKMEFTDLKTPSNNFDKMHNAYIEMVGMATDVPPEVILSKYSTSYTAHKGAFNDFIKSFLFKRALFAKNINMPVIFEIAKYLILNRKIEMPHPFFWDDPIIQMAALAGNWLGPVPGHINPAQEVAAKKMAVEEAFELRSSVAIENNHDWDNHIQEWQEEQEQFRKYAPEKQATVLQNEMQEKDEEDESQDENDISQR